MTATISPFLIQESLSLAISDMSRTDIVMDSDRFICLRHSHKPNEIIVVDMNKKNSRVRCRIPTSSGSAIMNPTSKVVALETKYSLQFFNIETQTLLKSKTMSEDVLFWKWIHPARLEWSPNLLSTTGLWMLVQSLGKCVDAVPLPPTYESWTTKPILKKSGFC